MLPAAVAGTWAIHLMVTTGSYSAELGRLDERATTITTTFVAKTWFGLERPGPGWSIHRFRAF